MNIKLPAKLALTCISLLSFFCFAQDAQRILEEAFAKETGESWSYVTTFPFDNDLPMLWVYVKARDDGSFVCCSVEQNKNSRIGDKYFEIRSIYDSGTQTYYNHLVSRIYENLCSAYRGEGGDYLSSAYCVMEAGCEISMTDDMYRGLPVWRIRKTRPDPDFMEEVYAEDFLVSKANGHILAIYCWARNGKCLGISEERRDFNFSSSFLEGIFDVPKDEEIVWVKDMRALARETYAQKHKMRQKFMENPPSLGTLNTMHRYFGALSGAQKVKIGLAILILGAAIAGVALKTKRQK